MTAQKNFDWNTIYSEMPVEEMGWYYPALDPDLEDALKKLDLQSGTFLDLGTGPGTQAVELAKKGFLVTGTDISGDAIANASKLSDKVEFVQDDILHSGLTRQFDLIFDRGCFHTLSEENRGKYVDTVRRLLKKEGLLFLKCFSNKNPDSDRGPYHFSKKMIERIFGGHFIIESMEDAEYQGTRHPRPKALFVIMKMKSKS